jgi:uncharacterized membrane protein
MTQTYTEGHLRSLAKVISWRILLTISHVINAWIITGSMIVGLQIAGLAAVINSILFWAHERSWNVVEWNRRSHLTLIFNEGHTRSVSKLVTWRILITASNFFIPFVVTGSWGSAALFVGVATIVNMFLYWSHERIWNWIRWHKKTLENRSGDAENFTTP